MPQQTSFSVQTHTRTELIKIEDQIQQLVTKSGTENGICCIFVPHTTAAVTINEGADPSVTGDLLLELNKVIPFDDHYSHYEGNSAAHIKSSLIGSSLTVIIEKGKIKLGTWQSIFFCEFDGPRNRTVWVKML